MRRLVPILAGAMLLAACGGSSPTADPSAIIERAFTSTSVIADGADRRLVPGSSVLVTFGADRISLNAGCNAMSAPARFDDGVITLTGDMATTLMACDEALMAQDDWLATFIAGAPTWTLDGQNLILESKGARITMVEDLEHVAQPEPLEVAALIGPTWTSTQISAPDGIDAQASVSMIFEPGQFVVDAGCNTLRAAYSLDGDTLRVEQVASTRMMCDPQTAALEAWLVGLLEADPSVVMGDGTLELSVADEAIAFASAG